MLMGALVITVGAEGEAEYTAPEYTYNTSNAKPSMDYLKGELLPETEEVPDDYVPVPVDSAEDKLATMDLRLEKDGYRLYVDAYSGEVATYCIATGETLFSNPYAVGGDDASNAIKEQLLSQIVVRYTDTATGNENIFYSFSETIQGESDETPYPASQIAVKNIKNGIRVEYTIGREEARMLVPRQIEKSAFETKILNVMLEAVKDNGGEKNFDYSQTKIFYTLLDASAASSTEERENMQKVYPITKKMAVYVLDPTAATVEIARIEQRIKTYCPNYTYEELDEDHMYAEYESKDENPPLFKMALEYTLDQYGMSVRLPANGIRFNETLYQLTSIEILPYMGAGKNPNAGYTFFPDGSGTLFDFQQIAAGGDPLTITGKVYGRDYAYHTDTIKLTHQEIIRYPVFGLSETEVFEETVDDSTVTGDVATAAETEPVKTEKKRGFLAIVEEGDALMELSSFHAVRSNPYNTLKMTVYPRPKDTYNLAESISVGSNDTWTVVSSRKYTGNYKVRYVMLTDDKVAADKGITDYYSCDYVGMAEAYRDYLERNEILTKLTAEDVKDDIPVYIETFGAIQTTKKILSVPVKTMAALTSFEDIQTMYNELSAEGVKNINFILTGYTKGGMTEPAVPYKLKWEKAVGGSKGFEELVAFAKEKGIGIFPDFDFVFAPTNTLFDGLTLKSHAVKTIDNRYTSKRVYSATKQTDISYFELAISPAYFNRFYEKLTENYLKYDPVGISVSSLGQYLNSDFDEDEPYNRADSKNFTIDAFEYLDKNYNSVMTSGGNAFSWKYVDHITDIALDSSRYAQSYASVPFLGMVLHGYVQFTGTPINMEGNIDYALLKAIENGAGLKFILSYANTEILKESPKLSQYYSVRYDIWFSDVVGLYNELNTLLKDVQTSVIIDHKFIEGERVPDDDELLADARQELEDAIKDAEELEKLTAEEIRAMLLEARLGIDKQINHTSSGFFAYAKAVDYDITDFNKINIDARLKAVIDATTTAARQQAVANLKKDMDSLYRYANSAATSIKKAENAYLKAVEYIEFIKAYGEYPAELVAELQAIVDSATARYNEVMATAESVKATAEGAYEKVKDVEGLEVVPYEVVLNIVETPKVEEKEEEVKSKYASDNNMIAVVTYENGKTFILNFNNYSVTTEYNGVIYTISAYGYVVFTK